AVLWEREPLVAAYHFQSPENIPEPHGTDIVVVILWSRLGVPLPADKFRGADGESLSAASHSFGATAEFEEKLYDHLHALLERRAGAALASAAIRWHKAPFRALLSYEFEDAPIFFGRT